MKRLLERSAAASFLALGALSSTPAPAAAYQIDCAILICLAGGWPSSTECTAARAEFIRRITPWPVEPPLQIWRCPLGVSYKIESNKYTFPNITEVAADKTPSGTATQGAQVTPSVISAEFRSTGTVSVGTIFQLISDYSDDNGAADVDISGPEYDFVRSIRVYSVEYARQNRSGRDDDCRRYQKVRKGTYGVQGDFSWHSSSVTDLPDAYEGVDGWGRWCPSINSRAVFIDWTDYEGNYGYEQVNY